MLKPICVFFLALTGCMQFKRVSIPAPTALNTPEERAAAFEKLAPVGSMSWIDARSGATVAVEYIQLRAGYRVEHPGDLLPLVPTQSPTAEYARAFEVDRTRAQTLGGWSTGTAIVGIGLGVVGISALNSATIRRAWDSYKDPTQSTIGTASLIAGGVTLFASQLLMLMGLSSADEARKNRQSAFASYPHDLRDHLNAPAEQSPAIKQATLWHSAIHP